MDFGWNKDIVIKKKLDNGDVVDVTTTPKIIILAPRGYTVEDILNSLCLCAYEIMETFEAQAKNIEKIMNTAKNDAPKKDDDEIVGIPFKRQSKK